MPQVIKVFITVKNIKNSINLKSSITMVTIKNIKLIWLYTKGYKYSIKFINDIN